MPKNSQCPLPIRKYKEIVMAHGSGGRFTQELIRELFLPAFKNRYLDVAHDCAVMEIGNQKIAFSTDSHVIRPLFFPGGDIGRLSVYGTCNDLAMSGARPAYLSTGMILGEGLSTETLWKITQSMQAAARELDIPIVTGDTKVIENHGTEELLINTTGIGVIEHKHSIAPAQVKPGDVVILSGDIARHGMAVMACREGLEVENPFQSDSTTLWPIIEALLKTDIPIHCMRDCTRGGLATALLEIVNTANMHIMMAENKIPVQPAVQGVCELLGIDPLYVANEGCFVLFTEEPYAQEVLDILHQFKHCKQAAVIGFVDDETRTGVTGINEFGGKRILDFQTGDQLPRIC